MDMSMTVKLQQYIFYVFSGFCLMLCLPLYLCYVDMLDVCGLCEWVENCVEWKLTVVSGTDPFSDEYFAFFSIVNVKVVAVMCITVVIYLLFSFTKDIWRFYGCNSSSRIYPTWWQSLWRYGCCLCHWPITGHRSIFEELWARRTKKALVNMSWD